MAASRHDATLTSTKPATTPADATPATSAHCAEVVRPECAGLVHLQLHDSARTYSPPGMVNGMASKKVTITLDEAQLDRIRALVHAGTAPTVSGFIQHAVAVALDDIAGWGALLAEALRETGGVLSDAERSWADEILGVNLPSRPAA